MVQIMRISAVVATIGRESIHSAITSLSNGTVVPDEIIVVVPRENSNIVRECIKNVKNIRLLECNFRGQIKQRIYGIKSAISDGLLIFDDDVIFQNTTVEFLFKNLKIGEARSPVFIDKFGESIYKNKKRRLELLKNLLALGKISNIDGKISRFGSNYGVEWSEISDGPFFGQDYVDVDWLPGGCQAIHKSEAISWDYYPFDGKAYCEDLICSHLLKNNGLRLKVALKSFLIVDPTPHPIIMSEFVKELNARRYFINLVKINKIFYFFYCLKLFNRLIWERLKRF